MPSFQITIAPNRRAAGRHVSKVRRALQKAFIEESKSNGLTQTKIAEALGVHRSVISRELRGVGDLTLGRVGELAWAMGRKAKFSLERAETDTLRNAQLATNIGLAQTINRPSQNWGNSLNSAPGPRPSSADVSNPHMLVKIL